jgi:hypothetical protein
MAPDILGQILGPEIITREGLTRYVRSASGIEAGVQQHVGSMLELRDRLRMLEVDDGRGRIQRETPELVGRLHGVGDGIEPVIGDLRLPFECFVKGRFRDGSQGILGAVYGRLGCIVISASFREIRAQVTVHESRVTVVQKGIELRSDFPSASVDQTDARW